MSRLTKARAQVLVTKPDRFVFVTLGGEEPVYAVNGAGTLPRKAAEEMLGLFTALPVQRKGGNAAPVMVPCEDGLFPGMSQTWRAARDGT